MAPSTTKQYNSALDTWENFCQTFKKNFFDPSVEDLLHFLEDRRQAGASYSSLNTIRSAISLISKNKIGENPLVSRFFKGVFRSCPPIPKYTQIWDVSKVLEHISSLHPLDNLNLESLSGKLTTLLALISAHRTQTIHAIRLDEIVTTEKGSWITVRSIIKNSRPGSASPRFFLPRFETKPELCAATTLEAYIRKTKNIRGDTQELFITTKKPYRPASKDTVSRWILNTLKNSGINTSLFKTHSTRHAASSTALCSGLSLATIRSSAGWSPNSSVFQKFYNIPIIPQEQEVFANAILNQNKSTN